MSALSALSGETYTMRTSSGSGARSPSWNSSSSAGEKRRERLARAGRRRDERMPPALNLAPAPHLRRGRRAKRL